MSVRQQYIIQSISGLVSITSLFFLATLVTSGTFGCKAEEAPAAGYVEKGDMYKDSSIPFQRVWRKPGADLANYNQLYIAPVNTSHMLSMTDWQKGERRDEIEKDIAHLAVYMQNSMKNAFRNDPKHRMTIVESESAAGPNTLILEAALIEVVPSKVSLNALGYAPFYIGTAVTAVRSLEKDVSSVAFEVRIRDRATGEIVAKFADREQQQAAPVNAKGMTWYGDAESIINQWSTQFVALANRKPGETVKDTEPFTLRPW